MSYSISESAVISSAVNPIIVVCKCAMYSEDTHFSYY